MSLFKDTWPWLRIMPSGRKERKGKEEKERETDRWVDKERERET